VLSDEKYIVLVYANPSESNSRPEREFPIYLFGNPKSGDYIKIQRFLTNRNQKQELEKKRSHILNHPTIF